MLQRRVVRASDELRAYERGLRIRAQRPLAEAVAQDLGLSADDLEPRMAAAAILTLFDLLGDEWDADPGAGLETGLESVDRVLRFIDGGIAALRGLASRP